jgi:sialidase-1
MKNIFLIFLITTNIQFSQNQFDYTDLFNAENNSEVSCYRIPSIITATNGDLIAAIDERVPSCGDLKWSRDINIVIRKSSDNGKTWGKIEKIIDYPLGQSASDPSMIIDKQTNTIFLFYNYMDLDNQKDIYYLKYISSNDNGKSWSKPVDITNQISKENWKNDFKFITSGRGIQTKNGTLLHCLVNLQKGTHVFGSNDNGKTWFITETPTLPGDESKIVELNDGSWMVNSRVNKLGYRYSHVSNDDGKTWISKKEESIIDPGCNGSLIRYSYGEKNLLVLTNINNKKERKEIVLRYSTDEGISWSTPKIIYNGEAAYSSMTVMENGNLGLFFEMNNYTKNVFTSIPINEIINDENN